MYIWWNRNFLPTGIQCPGDGTCSNRGTCNVSTGICVCDSGFQGQTCQGKTFLLLIGARKKKQIHFYRLTMPW